LLQFGYDSSMPATKPAANPQVRQPARRQAAARLVPAAAGKPGQHPQLARGAVLDVPLYKEVKRLMTEAVSSGDWQPGSVIPAEWALAERFHVAVGTVRKAVDELVAENILIRQQGRGTFVSAHNRERLMFHFFHIVRRDGEKLQPEVRMLSFRNAKADADEAAQLGLAVGAPVFRIRNLLTLSGRPIIFDTITVARALLPTLTQSQFQNRPNTIYHLYQTEFGVTVVRTAERLRATLADAEAAALLKIKEHAPVLEIRRVAMSFDNAPVEYRRSLVNTADYEYLSDLSKGG
jgi:GntR family transcriptional regulator